MDIVHVKCLPVTNNNVLLENICNIFKHSQNIEASMLVSIMSSFVLEKDQVRKEV